MSVFFMPSDKPPKRNVQFKIMVSAEEKAQVEALAEECGVTSSDLVRIAVNEFAAKRKSRRKSS